MHMAFTFCCRVLFILKRENSIIQYIIVDSNRNNVCILNKILGYLYYVTMIEILKFCFYINAQTIFLRNISILRF